MGGENLLEHAFGAAEGTERRFGGGVEALDAVVVGLGSAEGALGLSVEGSRLLAFGDLGILETVGGGSGDALELLLFAFPDPGFVELGRSPFGEIDFGEGALEGAAFGLAGDGEPGGDRAFEVGGARDPGGGVHQMESKFALLDRIEFRVARIELLRERRRARDLLVRVAGWRTAGSPPGGFRESIEFGRFP